MRRNFYETNLRTKQKILFESENKNGYIYGFSENYVRVKTPWRQGLVDNIFEYKLSKIDEDGYVYAEKNQQLARV